MSAHSVKLRYKYPGFKEDENGELKESESEGAVYISPNRARKLLKEGAATIDSQQPFVLRLAARLETTCVIQRWTKKSGSAEKGWTLMSGALLERRPPRV